MNHQGNWITLLEKQSAFLRATVILVLLGLIVLGAVALAVAAIRGQALHAGLFTLEAYVPADARKCAALTASVPAVSEAIKAQQSSLSSEITEKDQLLRKSLDDLDAHATRNEPGAEHYSVQEVERFRGDLDNLDKTQTEVRSSLITFISSVDHACAGN
jgi:hypothetical protein